MTLFSLQQLIAGKWETVSLHSRETYATIRLSEHLKRGPEATFRILPQENQDGTSSNA